MPAAAVKSKWVSGNLVFTEKVVGNDAQVHFGIDDDGLDVKFFGATASAYMLWDESADQLLFGLANIKLAGVGSKILIGTSTSDPILVSSTGTTNILELNAKLTGASGILRGLLSYAEFSGTHVDVATNCYAIRGYSKISGTVGVGNVLYSCGVQGKLELSGTIAGGKHAAVLAQLNSSAGLAGATGGTVYCLWADGMQIAANPAGAVNMVAIGIEMPDAAARFDSAIYVYGGASYLFDLQNSGVGSGYGALIAQAPGVATGSLKIRIGSTDYYIPVTTDPTA